MLPVCVCSQQECNQHLDLVWEKLATSLWVTLVGLRWNPLFARKCYGSLLAFLGVELLRTLYFQLERMCLGVSLRSQAGSKAGFELHSADFLRVSQLDECKANSVNE